MKDKKVTSNAMILYLAMMGIMTFIILYLQNNCNVPNRDEDAIEKAQEIVFYNELGDVIKSTKNLYEYGSQGRIYAIIPEDISRDTALCFRDKHVLFKAYVNDECVYSQQLAENNLYTNSIGTNWIRIPLLREYAGQRMYFDYSLCYDESGAGFDNMMVCAADSYLIHTIRSKIVALALPFIYLVIGIILVLLDLIVTCVMRGKHTFFYLGFLAVGVSSYCLAESQVFQMFITDQKIMHLIAIISMAIIPVPGVLYVDVMFGFKSKLTAFVFTLISFTSFLVLTILNYFDILDYHDSMIVLQLLILVGVVMMSYAMGCYIVRKIHAKEPFTIYILSTIIGLTAITVCGTMDVVRYWLRYNQDPAKFIRMGFLVFLLCFSVASAEQIVGAFQTSTRTKLISKLAYEDGLTGLKNRTSYNEMLEQIEENHAEAGIVMMDVNDLKQVNDRFGHEAGDSMLTFASEIIRDAFNRPGITCYRIGGDEFVAIVQSEHIKEDCEECMKRMAALYHEFNLTTGFDFKIAIAAGYSIYSSERIGSLEEVIYEADNIMYVNKRELKALAGIG